MILNLFGSEKKRIAEMVAAARAGDLDKVKAFLSKGTDINGSDPQSGDTALMAAIGENQRATIDYLLTQKADLTKEDPNGIFALMAAAVSRRDPELVGLLLAAGAPVDQTPARGITRASRRLTYVPRSPRTHALLDYSQREPQRQSRDPMDPLRCIPLPWEETVKPWRY